MVLAFWMVSRLTREIITLENQITKKQMELSNYQEYAGVLGGSSALHMGNIAGLSSSLLPRASLFAQYADQASSMSAMQNDLAKKKKQLESYESLNEQTRERLVPKFS